MNVQQTIVVAIATTIFTQIVVAFVAWFRQRIDLSTKKQLIDRDLQNQVRVLEKMRKHFEELLEKFEKRHLHTYNADAFEELIVEIYESIPKTDLYKIYGKKLPKVIHVYKQIEFLMQYTPFHIYQSFVTGSDKHRNSSDHKLPEDILEGDVICFAERSYINAGIQQSKMNIITVDKILKDIGNLSSFKFYWVSVQ